MMAVGDFSIGYRLMLIFAIFFPGFVQCQGNPPPPPPSNPGTVNLPSVNNCANAPLKPPPTDKIHVHLLFDTVGTGAFTRTDSLVCLNMPDFGPQMQLDFFPGAGSDDLNGKLDCSLDTCDEAIQLQCAKQRVRSYKNFVCCRVKGSTNQKCAQDQGVDWDAEIKPCLTSQEPLDEIRATVEMRKKHNISQTMIPAMIVNSVYDDCTSYSLWQDFVGTACQMLNPKPPKACGK